MAKRRRTLNPFGLAFLDVMSCGFGAAVLVFMLVKHNIAQTVIADEAGVVGSTLSVSEEELEADIERLMGRAASIAEEVEASSEEIVALLKTLATVKSQERQSDDGELDALKKELEDKQAALLKEKERGQQLAKIQGEGKRQYLTGLNVEGERILILFDRSASMVDDKLVNIIRGKHLPASERRKSGKWKWGQAILGWLLAHLPEQSEYQVYAFNDKVQSLLPKGAGWTSAKDKKAMRAVRKNMANLAPENGTNLQSALRQAHLLSPKPSAIYLITDGLPTLKPGGSQSGLVTGKERLDLWQAAAKEILQGVPIHTILLPTDGDPRAAGAFWALAAYTKGRFLAPAWDWP